MKTPSDALFLLIRSMTMSEKRYVKIYLSNNYSKKQLEDYLKLFDAIEGLRKYDEALLKNNLIGETLIKRIKKIKNSLSDVIMEGLEKYHSDSLDAKLRSKINQIEILFWKRLFKQCSMVLSKTKNIAAKNERWEMLMEIMEWERRLLQYTANQKQSDHSRISHNEQIQDTIHLLGNYFDYQKMLSQIILIEQKSQTVRNPKTKTLINSLLKKPLLTNDGKALSQKARQALYATKIKAYALLNKPEKAHTYSIAMKSLIPEAGCSMLELRSYFIALHHYGLSSLEVGKSNEVEDAAKSMRAIINTYDIKRTNALYPPIIIYSLDLLLQSYYNAGLFEKCIKNIEEYEEAIEKFHSKVSPLNQITFSFHVFFSYFGAEMYGPASIWLNKTCRLLEETELLHDVYSVCRMLRIIVNYELKEEDHLQYVLRSTYHYLSKSRQLYKFEKLMLDFIRLKLPKINSRKEQIDAFKKLKSKLEKIIKDPLEREVLRNFDFVSWLESKIENRSFAEIIRGKVYNSTSA